jgi:hypothetical protein
LLLLNSSQVRVKLEQGPKLQALVRARQRPAETIDTLYLTILSRFPTDEERGSVTSYIAAHSSGQAAALVDVSWALVNSTEFLLRH